jgi:hypothetical protein
MMSIDVWDYGILWWSFSSHGWCGPIIALNHSKNSFCVMKIITQGQIVWKIQMITYPPFVHIIHSHFNCTDTLQIHWATHQYMWIKSVGIGNHLPIITNISHSSIAQKSSRFSSHIIIHMQSVDLVCAVLYCYV